MEGHHGNNAGIQYPIDGEITANAMECNDSSDSSLSSTGTDAPGPLIGPGEHEPDILAIVDPSSVGASYGNDPSSTGSSNLTSVSVLNAQQQFQAMVAISEPDGPGGAIKAVDVKFIGYSSFLTWLAHWISVYQTLIITVELVIDANYSRFICITSDENLLAEAVADEPEMVMIDYDELMLTGYVLFEAVIKVPHGQQYVRSDVAIYYSLRRRYVLVFGRATVGEMESRFKIIYEGTNHESSRRALTHLTRRDTMEIPFDADEPEVTQRLILRKCAGCQDENCDIEVSPVVIKSHPNRGTMYEVKQEMCEKINNNKCISPLDNTIHKPARELKSERQPPIDEQELDVTEYIDPAESVQKSVSQKYGLILYNPSDREGANIEFDSLKKALESAGCHVFKSTWKNTFELENCLETALKRISADCSLLFVCLMAHGTMGKLKGNGGSEVSINQILCQITTRISCSVPVVILVQACQQSNIPRKTQQNRSSIQSTDPRRFRTGVDSNIILTRSNTVLLLATVPGSIAMRGAFTLEFAKQLNCRQKDIYSMFNDACQEMDNPDTPWKNQIPEMRSTLKRSLMLNHSETS